MTPKPKNHGDMPMAGVFHRVSMLARNDMMERFSLQKWFVESGFKPPCIGIIHTIGNMQPVSQKKVSEWIGMDPSDLVSVIDKLEKDGYVVRKRDPQDRRRQLLSLTAKGANMRKKLITVSREAIDETLKPLTAKERETLRSILAKVLDHHHAIN